MIDDNENYDMDFERIYEYLYEMDCRIIQNNQYSRRENLIISGIPNYICQQDLENTVINLLRVFGIKKISSYDIVACHRLKSKNEKYLARTIVRFVNRKLVDYCLSNRDYIVECKQNLKMNLRLYEDLSAINEHMLKECIKLKNTGIIKNFIIRNGNFKIFRKDSSKPIRLNHPDDFYNLFPDIYF